MNPRRHGILCSYAESRHQHNLNCQLKTTTILVRKLGKPLISPSEETSKGEKSAQKTKKRWNAITGSWAIVCEETNAWNCIRGFTAMGSQCTLEGHNKQSVIGITLLFGSNKLYSGGKDKSVRVWDCNTGQCLGVVIMEDEVGTLVSEGHWIFVGLRNAVKAWNIEGNTEITLSGPVGEVYAPDVGNDIVFAGSEDAGIYAWKSGAETNSLELATSLKGHRRGVVSLIVGANRLYSGSRGHTIRASHVPYL